MMPGTGGCPISCPKLSQNFSLTLLLLGVKLSLSMFNDRGSSRDSSVRVIYRRITEWNEDVQEQEKQYQETEVVVNRQIPTLLLVLVTPCRALVAVLGLPLSLLRLVPEIWHWLKHIWRGKGR